MYRYLFKFAIPAVLLAGLSGTAAAETIEATTRAPVRADQAVPLPRSHPPLANRHVAAEETAGSTTPSPVPPPICDWFACSQYVIVGMGF
jgi:hypothetical protein